MKELRLKNIMTKSLALLFIMVCVSCKDDLESKELKVYVVSSTGESKVKTLVNHPTSEGELVMKLPIRSTRALLADAAIEATINESLVTDYNEQHGTEYKLLPASIASILDKATLKKGSSESEDSLGFVCQDVKKLEEPGYILPITVTNLSSADKGITISNNLNTVYFVINVKEYRMYNTTEAVGTLKNRTGWTAIGADGKTYPELFDGNNKTGVGDDGKQLLLTVDMGSVSSIKGLRFTPRNSVSFDLDGLMIEISEDGQTWHSLKDIILSGAVSPKPGAIACQTVGFYKSWPARYIKIKAYRATTASVTTVSEIDILE